MSFNAILDSSIMQKGLPATAGSKMLEGFMAPVDSTVVERLVAAGVSIVGRFDTSEFGVSGLFCAEHGASGDTFLFHTQLESIASGEVDFALCNDYTGAVSRVAADAGLYYTHPTYGSVSRYGLIPVVSSMDQIGIVCKTPEVGFEVLRIIAEYDSKDGVMVNDKLQMINDKKIRINNKALKYSNIYKQVMQILCCAELGNNISRYDGIKFGYRAAEYHGLQELYTKSRTEAFGEDVKLAAILGAMVLSQENYVKYYDKAMRLRRMIRDSLDFSEYDVITNDGSQKAEGDSLSLLMLSRLCGLPSLSAPDGNVYVASAGREDRLEVIGRGEAI